MKPAIRAAFGETLAVLRRRVTALVQALVGQPGMDASTLKNILDGIAAH